MISESKDHDYLGVYTTGPLGWANRHEWFAALLTVFAWLQILVVSSALIAGYNFACLAFFLLPLEVLLLAAFSGVDEV